MTKITYLHAENIVNITRSAEYPLYGADDVVDKDSVAFANTVISWAYEFEELFDAAVAEKSDPDYFLMIDEFTERKCKEERAHLGLPPEAPKLAHSLYWYRDLQRLLCDMVDTGVINEDILSASDYGRLMADLHKIAVEDSQARIPLLAREREMFYDRNLSPNGLALKYGEYPEFTRLMWRTDVQLEVTEEGYWPWVCSRIENEVLKLEKTRYADS